MLDFVGVAEKNSAALHPILVVPWASSNNLNCPVANPVVTGKRNFLMLFYVMYSILKQLPILSHVSNHKTIMMTRY